MNEEKLIVALHGAITESTENLIFQELEEVRILEKEEAVRIGDYQVSLKIKEPFSGTLYLIFDHTHAEQIVTEMIGEVIDDEKSIIDGLNELCNTIGGRFLAKYVPDESFELGLPECGKIESLSELPYDSVQRFYFQDTQLCVSLEQE
ncbi:MAG: chemotaxis protein CheX [Calditrichaeota bacterium]|nr:chemotaxis protein CheX [Calditrichota bacterium]